VEEEELDHGEDHGQDEYLRHPNQTKGHQHVQSKQPPRPSSYRMNRGGGDCWALNKKAAASSLLETNTHHELTGPETPESDKTVLHVDECRSSQRGSRSSSTCGSSTSTRTHSRLLSGHFVKVVTPNTEQTNISSFTMRAKRRLRAALE